MALFDQPGMTNDGRLILARSVMQELRISPIALGVALVKSMASLSMSEGILDALV